jgi:hypothetical protein
MGPPFLNRMSRAVEKWFFKLEVWLAVIARKVSKGQR